MGSWPLAQRLFDQHRNTSEPEEPCCRNASQRITASNQAGANREPLATILRLLDVSAAQPRAPESGLLPIKLVPSMRLATAAAGAALRYSSPHGITRGGRQRLAERRAPRPFNTNNPDRIPLGAIGSSPGLNELQVPGFTSPMRLTL